MSLSKRYESKYGYYRIPGYNDWEGKTFIYDQDLGVFVDEDGKILTTITDEYPSDSSFPKMIKQSINAKIKMSSDIEFLNDRNDEFENLLIECVGIDLQKYQTFLKKRPR